MNRFLAMIALLLVAAQPLEAQQLTPESSRLEGFIEQFAALWQDGETAAIVALVGEDELLLDTGSGTAPSNGRHTAAALRQLLGDRQTVRLEVISITMASVDPPRGFSELNWTFRERDMPGEPSRSIYVAVVQDEQGWRISELRLLP